MSLFPRMAAEGLGTGLLLCVVIGSGIMGENLAQGNAAIALLANTLATVWGLYVLIEVFGPVSGAHFNPAVTTAFAAARRFPWREVPGYVAAQLGGAFAASGLLRVLFPADETLGATLPAGSATQSFILEIVLTFLLMLVILSVSTGDKEKGITAGIVVGAVIALEAMFAGPISGASMNPARSLAPAVVSGHLETIWIYLAAPVLGALLAVPACCGVRERGCCCATKPEAAR